VIGALYIGRHGLIVAPELATPRWPLAGVLGSLLWRFDGQGLKLVWFSGRDDLATVIRRGLTKLSTRPFATYEATKRSKAAYARARRADGDCV
jgi:hypothetical protein